MRKLILFVCLAVATLSQADGIDKSTALEKAKAFVQSRTTANGARRVASASTRLSDVDLSTDGLYGFNVGGSNGFVIVAADNAASVIGYADEGSLDPNNMPDALKTYLQKMGVRVKAAIKEGASVELAAEGSSTSGANKAAARRATANTTDLAIGPLLTTKWSQFAPYYNLTPAIDGTQTLTCCVATAMAQIVYYLYCTQDGQTSTTFDNGITTGTYQVSGSRTYDWSSMLPSYLGGYTEAQATAIATLMRDCGYAINAVGGEINYGVSESTAYQYTTPSAYSTYFGITGVTDTYVETQKTISDASTFFSTIDKELNNYRPVQVCGDGHSFVCDGRAADGIYYHFNFGYGGGGDGFYCAGAYNGYDAKGDMEITYGFKLAQQTQINEDYPRLLVAYNSAVKTMGLRPVGTIPGMYQQSYYETLQAYLDTAKAALDEKLILDEEAELLNHIGMAEQDLVNFTTPFDVNGYSNTGDYTASGTSYRIRTLNTLGDKYGYIGWYYDNDEGVYKEDDPVTSVYTAYTGSKWRFVYDASSNAYYVGNNTLDQYITEMPGYGQDPVWCIYGFDNKTTYHNSDPSKENSNGNVPNKCEVIPTNYLGDGTFAVTIRPMASGYTDDSQRYLTCWEESGSSSYVAGSYSSASNNFYVHGGDAYGEYYAKWVFIPVYASGVNSTAPKASFSMGSVEIVKDSTATQTVSTNSTGTITYSSSDITVATVDPSTGAVTGVGEGTATITAAIGCTTTYNKSGYAAAVATYTVKVTCPEPTAVTSVADNTPAATAYYSLSGQRIGKAQRGINLISKDGKVRKVLVK